MHLKSSKEWMLEIWTRREHATQLQAAIGSGAEVTPVGVLDCRTGRTVPTTQRTNATLPLTEIGSRSVHPSVCAQHMIWPRCN